MFAKLAIIIVAIGLTACGLLAMRQARLQAAHELAQAQLRIAREDERLLTLHARIAERITPERIRALAEASLLSATEPAIDDIATAPTDSQFSKPGTPNPQGEHP